MQCSTVTALLAVAIVLGNAPQAEANVLCTKPNGAVFVRAHCKANEMPLDPVTLGLQGPPGPKGDPGPKGLQGPPGAQGPAGPGAVVKDTNGTFVGLFLSPSRLASYAEILRSVGDTAVVFLAASQGFPPLRVYYTSADCSGPGLLDPSLDGYIFSPQDSIPFTASGQILDTTLYYTSAPAVLTTPQSEAITPRPANTCTGPGSFFTPPSTCCSASIGGEAIPLAPFTTAELPLFVPPIQLEVQQ